MSQKQVMPKSEDLSRSLEINAIWTFDTEFPTTLNKSCTYITFKSIDLVRVTSRPREVCLRRHFGDHAVGISVFAQHSDMAYIKIKI